MRTPEARGPRLDHVEILLVEDNLIDRKAVQRFVTQEALPYTVYEASSLSQARALLRNQALHVVLLDYSLQDGSGFELLDELNVLEVPVILITGAGSEELAATAFHSGIADYLIKDVQGSYLSLLPTRINAVVTRVALERDRDRLIRELEEALATITSLRGMIPICSCCKRIRKDDGFWESVEAFIMENSLAELTHGLCPACYSAKRAELGLEPK